MKAEIGAKFGRLTVIEKTKMLIKDKRKDYYSDASICKCDCGKTTKIIRDNSLLRKKTQSCGCYKNDISKNRVMTHGKSKINIKLHNCWKQIKQRCLNSKCKAYKNYGARGIKISESWQNFANFYDDMASTWKIGLTIERIDNNGPYSKENCIWTNRKRQQYNRRVNIVWLHEGKWLTSEEFGKIINVKPKNLSANNYYGKKYKHKRLYDGDVCL